MEYRLREIRSCRYTEISDIIINDSSLQEFIDFVSEHSTYPVSMELAQKLTDAQVDEYKPELEQKITNEEFDELGDIKIDWKTPWDNAVVKVSLYDVFTDWLNDEFCCADYDSEYEETVDSTRYIIED